MSKPYLVIIHGFLQRFHCFPEFIKDMEKNFNVLFIDLPGYGENYNLNIFCIDKYLDFIYKEITNYINLKKIDNINLLGWSLGGNISILLAKKYPNIFKKIILLCSNPCFVKSNTNKYGMNKDDFLNFYHNIQTNPKKASEKFLILQFFGLDKNTLKKYYLELKKLYECQKLPDIKTLIFNLSLLNQDIRPILKNLDNEMIYILSEKDNLIPKDIAKYLTYIKKNKDQIYIMPNATHVPMLTNKDMLQSLLFSLS